MKRLFGAVAAMVVGLGLGAGCGPNEAGSAAPEAAPALARQTSELVQASADTIAFSAGSQLAEVYVNGQYVGSNAYWAQPPLQANNLSARVNAGDVVAVKVERWSGTDGSPFLADLLLRNGQRVASTEKLTWRCTNTYQANWYTTDFQDFLWPLATEYGANGVAPWYFVQGISPEAKWIGTANRYDMTIYCRAVVLGCGPNVARDRPTSPTNTSPTSPAGAATVVDDDFGSGWEGNPGGSVQVDLGADRIIGRASVRWSYQVGSSARTELQYFDGKAGLWRPMGTFTQDTYSNGSRQTQGIFPRVSARWVRLVGTQTNGGKFHVMDMQLFAPCDLCELDMAYKRRATTDSADYTAPIHAVDGDPTTVWKTHVRDGGVLKVDLGQPIPAETLSIQWSFDPSWNNRTQSTLQLQMSNDNVTWQPLPSLTHTLATNGTVQTVTTPQGFRYLRAFSTDWGLGSIADLQVRGRCAECGANNEVYQSWTEASGSYGGSTPFRAVDGDFNTTWQSNSSTGAWLFMDFGPTPVDIGRVVLAWGWDSSMGTSADSLLEYRDEVRGWVPLETFRHTPATNGRRQSLWFPTVNTRALRFTATRWNGGWGYVREVQACPLF